MHVADIPDALAGKDPDSSYIILDRPYTVSGRTISHLELRLYLEKRLAGEYCIITAYAHMDAHTIETIYDEGYRGETPLSDAVEFIMSGPGPAGLLLRVGISLDMALTGKV